MDTSKTYDVIILGSGPAGLQAAIHASRKKASVLMLGRMDNSSLYWAHVENFCCQMKMAGEDILKTGREQAAGFGTEFLDEDVLEITKENDEFHIATESGKAISGRALILATGSSRNKLGVPGEKELLGKGVSYCVDCDGGFFRGETVVVAGCRSAAGGGALALTNLAGETHLVCKELDLAPAMREKLDASGVILHEGASIEKILGQTQVEGVELDDGSTLACAGVFIELGAKGVLELTASLGLMLDETMKYIDTDKKMHTNVDGVFAAGDITGPPLQMAKAVGEGCVAGIEAASFARKLRER